MFSAYTNGDLRMFSAYTNGDLRMFSTYVNKDLCIFIYNKIQIIYEIQY